MNLRRNCFTCRYAKDYGCMPPTVGGVNDGVNCTSPEHLKATDDLEGVTENTERGFVNIFKVEIMNSNKNCYWWKETMTICECCGREFFPEVLDDYNECPDCARENSEYARVLDCEECPELQYANFEAKIKCGECDNIKTVGGFIWYYRLCSSKTDKNGNYLGWNCDMCADRIEAGMGY